MARPRKKTSTKKASEAATTQVAEKTKETNEIEVSNEGFGAGIELKAKVGDSVYLTYRSSPMVTLFGTKLGPLSRTVVIPDNATEKELIKITKMIDRGVLSLGKPGDPNTKSSEASEDNGAPEVLEWYMDILDDPESLRKALAGLVNLGQKIEGWQPIHIIAKLRAAESNGARRTKVLDLLERASSVCARAGISNVRFNPDVHGTDEVFYDGSQFREIRTRG